MAISDNTVKWKVKKLSDADTIAPNEVMSISKGGTGATNKKDALVNLGLTATAEELNVLDGITVTTTELNCCDGVTSNIQTQLDNKLNTNGIAVKATADANGNNIIDTYSTKTELTNGLSGKANSSHNHSASEITSGTLSIARGGTGGTTAADALSKLGITYGTADKTAGSSALATGSFYFQYE